MDMNERTLTSMFRIFAHSGQIQGYRLSGKRAVKIADNVFVVFASILIGLYVGWLIWR